MKCKSGYQKVVELYFKMQNVLPFIDNLSDL